MNAMSTTSAGRRRADQARRMTDCLRGRINQAVTRILTLKFKLGLFDHPLRRRRPRPTRRGQRRPRPGPPGRRRVDDAAAQPEQRAAAVDRPPSRRDRPERGLDPRHARRLERQLAGRLRQPARSAAGARRTRSRRVTTV